MFPGTSKLIFQMQGSERENWTTMVGSVLYKREWQCWRLWQLGEDSQGGSSIKPIWFLVRLQIQVHRTVVQTHQPGLMWPWEAERCWEIASLPTWECWVLPSFSVTDWLCRGITILSSHSWRFKGTDPVWLFHNKKGRFLMHLLCFWNVFFFSETSVYRAGKGVKLSCHWTWEYQFMSQRYTNGLLGEKTKVGFGQIQSDLI